MKKTIYYSDFSDEKYIPLSNNDCELRAREFINNNDKEIFVCNELFIYWIRFFIIENKNMAKKIEIIYKDEKFTIDTQGCLSNYINGMLGQFGNVLNKIMGIK